MLSDPVGTRDNAADVQPPEFVHSHGNCLGPSSCRPGSGVGEGGKSTVVLTCARGSGFASENKPASRLESARLGRCFSTPRERCTVRGLGRGVELSLRPVLICTVCVRHSRKYSSQTSAAARRVPASCPQRSAAQRGAHQNHAEGLGTAWLCRVVTEIGIC